MFSIVRQKTCGVLIFVMLFSTFMPIMAFGAAEPFRDVAESYAQHEVQSLVDSGIISGYEDGSFQPNKWMTRAELAKILTLSLGLKENAEKAFSFQDVDPQSWYRGYVGALVQAGITRGTSETTFAPNAPVTREELVVFFIRCLGLEDAARNMAVDTTFSDRTEIASWAQADVSLSFKIGFVQGIEGEDGTLRFSPKQNAERQALARLAYEFTMNKERYMEKAKSLLNLAHVDLEVIGVTATGNTSVEVTFNQDVNSIAKEDFTFDNGLTVSKAKLKANEHRIVILETSSQTADKQYKLSYKGVDTGKSLKGIAVANLGGGGGGGGSGASSNSSTQTDLDRINSGGTFTNLTISSGGTVGPTTGTTTITGTLTLNPGEHNTLTLRNIVAANIEVLSGDENSVKLQHVTVQNLKVHANNQSKKVRIQSLEGTSVTNTLIESKTIIESTYGTLGNITIGGGASNQQIIMRGSIDGTVTAQASGVTITLEKPEEGNGQTVIASLIAALPTNIVANAGTSLGLLNIFGEKTSVHVGGSGTIQSMTVADSAVGSELNIGGDTTIIRVQLHANITLSGDANKISTLPIVKDAQVMVTVAAGIEHAVKKAASSLVTAAIDSIGAFTEYSASIEMKINEAGDLYVRALLLGAADADIPNLSTLISAKNRIAVLKSQASGGSSGTGSDGGGNTGPDLNKKTATPTVTGNVYEGFGGLTGYAEPGALVTLTRSNGRSLSVYSSVQTETYGLYTFTLEQLFSGEQLAITAVKHGKTVSDTLYVTVLELPRTSTPTVTGAVYENGVSLSGMTESNTIVWITLKTANGSFLGATGTYNGLFDFRIFPYFQATAGEQILVTAKADGKKESNPVMIPVLPLNGKTAAPTVTETVYEASGYLSGYAAPGALITITSANGQFNTTTTNQGSYSTYLNWALAAGEELAVTAEVIGKSVSEAVYVTVAASPKTSVPTVTGSVYTDGVWIGGFSDPYANITLLKADGSFIGNTWSTYDGSYSMKFEWNAALTAGEQLRLTAKADKKKESDPALITVLPLNGRTAVPTVTGTVYELSSSLSGYAVPGALITITRANGQFNTTTAYQGSYSTYLGWELAAGEKLAVTADVIGKSVSEAVYVTVAASPKTSVPTVTGSVYTDGVWISGTAEQRAYVTLKRADGTNIGYTRSSYDGSYSMKFEWNAALTAGEQLRLTANADMKKESDPVRITVLPLNGRTAVPTVTGTVYELSSSLSGYAVPGALITITRANGQFNTTTAYQGSYSTYLGWELAAGEKLAVTADVIGKSVSEAVYVTVAASPKTSVPTVTGSVYTDGVWISGTAEQHAYVTLKRADGTYIRGAYSSYDGSYSMMFNVNETLMAGEQLLLTAKADMKKESDPVRITVLPAT